MKWARFLTLCAINAVPFQLAARCATHGPEKEKPVLELQRTLSTPGGNPVESLGVDGSGKNVIWSQGNDNKIRMWTEKTGSVVFTPKLATTGKLTSVLISQDATRLASVGQTAVTVYDVTSREIKNKVEFGARIGAVAMSADGNLLAISNRYGTYAIIWDLKNGKQKYKLLWDSEPDDWIRVFCFDESGTLLASGHELGSVRLWEASSGKLRKMFPGHKACITALVFSPDTKKIVSGGFDEVLSIWDITSGSLAKSINQSTDVFSIAVTNHGNMIASGNRDGSIRLYDLDSGKRSALVKAHDQGVISVIISRDGKTMFTASPDGTIKFWNLRTKD